MSVEVDNLLNKEIMLEQSQNLQMNFILQMALALKLCILDPMLVKQFIWIIVNKQLKNE